jgi:hypothetical protein
MKILLLTDEGLPAGFLEGVTINSDRKITAFANNVTMDTTPTSPPEVPATPTEQDIVDALVALGLVTQAEA